LPISEPDLPPIEEPPVQTEAEVLEALLSQFDTTTMEGVLMLMVKMGASDLHMNSLSVPYLRIDGEMRRVESLPAISSEELWERLLPIMPRRNQEEFLAKNDTDFAHEIEGYGRFRSNVFMDHHGVGAVFRLIPSKILDVETLKVPSVLMDLCKMPKGLLLVTGPTGSGKSTTLAALIDFINRSMRKHIITIEDPIEFVHHNQLSLINQREVHSHTESFKKALRAALREDPDIILVGEMRDLETIAIAIEMAVTGHLVLGTLHTSTAVSTVDRIIDQFPSDQQSQIRTMLSDALIGVVSQMLLKKISGGRVAAYEVMVSNVAVSNLIREGKTYQISTIMQTGKKMGQQMINSHLSQLVKEGIVNADDALDCAIDKENLKVMIRGVS
jgi:twitching motility protein PilT